MKETVQAFVKRTGLAYRPPEALSAAGAALRARESCPTLFRYTGPRVLLELIEDRPLRLAPEASPWIWMGERPGQDRMGEARRFGSAVLLQPLRYQVCRFPRAGVWIGVNRPAADDDALLWLPPAAFLQQIAWDRLREPTDAKRRLGPGYEEEKQRMRDRLSAYVEELAQLEHSGAPAPEKPWCAVSRAERARLLAEAGVAGRWTSSGGESA